ncbi:MAG: SpoIIE family protein phosphatase [Mycobacteriales bacterium]
MIERERRADHEVLPTRVLDGMADAVIVVDEHMTIRYANRAAAQLLGVAADLAGLRLSDFIPERYREAHAAGFARYVQTRSGVLVGGHPVRVPALRADGTETDVQLTLAATTSTEGQLLLVGSLRDLTSVRELEQKAAIARYLQASMDVAEQLANAGTVDDALPLLLPTLCDHLDWDVAGLWEVRGDELVNVDLWQVSGPARDDFTELTKTLRLRRGVGLPGQVWSIGRPLHIELLKEDIAFPRRSAALASGLKSSLVFPLLGSGEVLGVIELYSTEARAPDAAQIEVVAAIGKQLGQFIERMRAEDELRHAEQRYRSLAEAFALDVFRTSAAGELLTDMPRWRAFTGQHADALLDLGWVDAVLPAAREGVLTLWREAIATTTPFTAEFRIQTVDGGERDVLMRSLPIIEKHQVREWIGSSTDVTEQRYAERAAVALADTLQRSLLPPHLPQVPGVELAARYRAGGEGLQVGGDFYDVFAVDPQTWVIVIGDVCGKGAEAASITALARYTVRAAAMHQQTAAGIASVLNNALRRGERQAPFLTAVVVILRLSDSPVLEVVCAGHPSPLLRHIDGTVHEVGDDGDLLGVFDTVDFKPKTVPLGCGDIVVFYTDGVTEARNESGEQYGDVRLSEEIAGCDARTAEAMSMAIMNSVVEHRGARGGGDDVALLSLRRL